MLTIDNLYEEAERFLWDNYGMTLDVPIDVEEIYDDIQGAFECTAKEPHLIVIAELTMQYGSDEYIYDVLRHELVHYALHRQGRDYHDGADDFESELRRLGIGSSGSAPLGRYHLYACPGCNQEIPSRKKFSDEEIRVKGSMCCERPVVDLRRQAIYNGEGRVY